MYKGIHSRRSCNSNYVSGYFMVVIVQPHNPHRQIRFLDRLQSTYDDCKSVRIVVVVVVVVASKHILQSYRYIYSWCNLNSLSPHAVVRRRKYLGP